MKINPIWFICIAVRTSLAYIIYRFGNINKHTRYVLVASLLIMGAGFIFKGYFGSNNEMQIAPVFWHDSRYIHGSLYILASLYLLNGNNVNSSTLILTDIAFSIMYRAITDR